MLSELNSKLKLFPDMSNKLGNIQSNSSGSFKAPCNCYMMGYIGSNDSSKPTRLYLDGVQFATAPITRNETIVDGATRFYFVPIPKGSSVTTQHTDTTFSDNLNFYGVK